MKIDCISRQDVERYIEGFINEYTPKEELEFINLELDGLKHIPSVTPQEPREITLEDVKGYCKPRCLTIITNELLYELTHPKIKALEQEPVLDKIFNIVFPLSIMSTPELEHEAIMQIAEMLEPLCLPESEVEDGNDD